MTYIAEQNYPEAMKSLERAEETLKDCDEEMGAYIYINKSISLQKLKQLTEALQAFEIGVNQYHVDEIVPDDVIRCAATLYYRLGQKREYENYKQQIFAKMGDMYVAEFMDACKELFACGMDSGDDELMTTILHSMNQYMEKYPDEIKVGLVFAELEYSYAIKRGNRDRILDALEKKNAYKDRIMAYSMEKRVKSLEQYIEINSQILDLEMDAITGFKNRKAYYKDVDFMEHDKEISRQPVGVVFADVNGLKEINDRFGGDEFVILSFDEEKAAFDEKLKKLSALWEDNQYSASIGSVWQEQARDFEKSVAVADEMMYRNKSRYYEKRMHGRRAHVQIETVSEARSQNHRNNS